MKTLNVYSYDVKGKSPQFRDLEFWEIERDNLGLLGIEGTINSDVEYVSPDCILDYIHQEHFGIFDGVIWIYTLDEIKELLNNV